jgi:hypothetical protein
MARPEGDYTNRQMFGFNKGVGTPLTQIRQAIVSFPIGFDGWASSKAATGADARGTQQNPDASRNAVWPRR